MTLTRPPANAPKGWQLVQMNDLKADGKYSFIGGPFGSDLTSADYTQCPGVPVIRGINLGGKDSRFIDDYFVFVSEEKASALSRNIAYPGDLVFTQRGTLGQVGLIPKDSGFRRYVISQSQMKVTVDESKADPRFLWHYFRSPIAAALLEKRTLATGVPHINLAILKAFPVILPPLADQKQIAAILDKADAVRQKRKQALAKAETLLSSLFRFAFADELLAEHQTKSLGSIAAVVSGVTKGRDFRGAMTHTVPYLRVANVQAGYLDLSEIKTIDALPDEVASLMLKTGDVVMTEGGDHDKLGRGALWEGQIPNCIHQNHIFRVRLDREVLLPEVFVSYLCTPNAVNYFLKCAKKTTNLATINMTQLKALPVTIPSVEKQKRFKAQYWHVRRTVMRLQSSYSCLDNLFCSLVQRAFRGEL